MGVCVWTNSGDYIYIYIYIVCVCVCVDLSPLTRVRALYVCMYVCMCVCVCVCVLAVYNKAQRISNREFKLWTFLQGTESRVATFLAETCVIDITHVH